MPSDLVIEDIDETQLSHENGELYLFQWLALAEKYCSASSPEGLKAKQSSLESTLIRSVAAGSPYPLPGRALRNLISRCLVMLYSRGDSKTLFDTLQSLVKIAGDVRLSDKELSRIAAFFCIGNLMTTFGAQFMSFMAEISVIALKTAKSSGSSLLRYHSLVSLRKSLLTAKRAVNEATHKDITKQMKTALGDKSLPVQRAAADLLLIMHDPPDVNTTTGEIESIISLCTKGLETADRPTRHSFAKLVGHLLASTQVDRFLSTSQLSHTGNPDVVVEDSSAPKQAGSENKFTLSLNDMFAHLSSQFTKFHASRRVRVGVFHFYVELLIKLGSTFVESNYGSIVHHFMAEIVTNSRSATRYEVLLVRKLVEIILRNLVGVRLLGEQAQIAAIQELSRSYLKRWPSIMPGQVSPDPLVLVIILREAAGLLQQLGNTPPPVQDALAEPLVTLLAHPSHAVRVNTSRTLQSFCYSTPLRLPKTIYTIMELLQRDVNALVVPGSPPDLPSRALGYGYGLAALVSVIPERPLYVSYDASAKVLDMAVQLLKHAGDHDITLAEVEIEVAWTSVASLMSHGPIFVRPHLPQLLVLWRNALPKPSNKDLASVSGRTTRETSFLLHVRECALGAMLCFLQHNASSLVTLDVARRIASVLSNALVFVNSISHLADEVIEPHMPTLEVPSLRFREDLLRRRIYQCFAGLGFSSIAESTQASLLQASVSLFASPDGYSGSSVQAAIASSSGTFTSIWQTIDGYAYGITHIGAVNDQGGGFEDLHNSPSENFHRDSISVAIDSLARMPVLDACEHDPLSICDTKVLRESSTLEAPPAPTAVVDSAIYLFAQSFGLQDLTSATRVINQIAESVRSTKLEKNSGRKAAVLINVAVAVVLTLRGAVTNQSRRIKEILSNAQVVSPLSSLLKDMLVDGDSVLRSIASESIGRLANYGGMPYLSSQIKYLVDVVVNNRDPNARAGCALAFGAIYSHVGGLAAGPLLKTTVNVLMSLGSDPHPVVHCSALNALAQVANAASLSYAPFVSSTLGMLLKVFLMDSHEREGGVLNNANLSGDYPAYPAVCRIIDAVITTSGPDLQESPRTRGLVLNLVHELSVEEDESVCVEALNCIQHLLMFTPQDIQIPELLSQFRAHITSPRRPLKLASINALYQLVQKDALSMSKLGGDRLVEDLFLMLDDDPSVEGVRDVISSWLEQTVVHNPSAWIDLCQRIMSRTTASQRVADAIATHGTLHDDEGVSLAGKDSGVANGRTTCRWRTQLFALHCLHKICSIVAKNARFEQLDSTSGRKVGIGTIGLLISRVGDLIKMAFTAATAYITEIRLEGLVVLRDVIKVFAKVPDPVYSEALLLEQYQAPITAALTPGISTESTPEILASAIQTSALFVGCGIVKDVSRMGRILKFLTSALHQSQSSGMLSLGEAGRLSPNASAMLRISTLSAWAQLGIASSAQKHLSDILNPLRATLIPMWIAYLRDYAIIRASSEIFNDSSVMPDSVHSSLGKEVLLPYYLDSWQFVLRAVADALQSGDSLVFAAMHGHDTVPKDVSVPEGPAVFFFVIFGLAFEALSSSSPTQASTMSTHEATMIAAIQALKCLVDPKYSGKAMMETAVFDELISLCYRIAMIETSLVQIHLIELLTVLSAGCGQSNIRFANGSVALDVAESHCLRICAYVLKHALSSRSLTTDSFRVIVSAFSAFCIIAEGSKHSDTREDIRGVAILIYSDFLMDEASEIDFVAPTLQSLKSLLELPVLRETEQERFRNLVNNLLSACLLNINGMRNRQGVIVDKKIRSNFLAAVLILTVVPPDVRIGKGVTEHLCYLISERLLANSDMSLTAAQCAKTLIITSLSGNPLLCQCSKILVPALVEYFSKVIVLGIDQKTTDSERIVLDEVWKTFTVVFCSVTEMQRTALLCCILPMLALLLRRPTSLQIFRFQATEQLLFFATTSPSSFREAVLTLSIDVKELLEQEIRQAVGNSKREPGTSQPQISLRFFH